jgi:hypothetical protein
VGDFEVAAGGREGGTDFPKDLSTENRTPDCQASALVVVEPDPFLTVSFLQDLVLGAQVLDDVLLLSVDQAGEDGEEKLPWLEKEGHNWSDAVRSKEASIGDTSRAVDRLKPEPIPTPRPIPRSRVGARLSTLTLRVSYRCSPDRK